MQKRREKNVQTAGESERKEKIGRQSQVLVSPCLSLLLLQSVWFIRDVMAGQGKSQVWCFGRRKEKGMAGDWFVIAVLAVWYTVSACSPFNSSHRKSNTIHISACRSWYISFYVCSFSLWKEKGESSSCHVMFEKAEKKGRGKQCHLKPHGGTGVTITLFFFFYTFLLYFVECQELWIWLLFSPSLCLFLHYCSGLYNHAFINTSFAMCSVPSRWLTEGYRGHRGGGCLLPQENHIRIPNGRTL